MLRRNLVTSFGNRKSLEMVGAEVVLVSFLHRIAERRITNDDGEFFPWRVKAGKIERRIEAAAIRFDMSMTIVVQQQVDLTNSRQRLVGFFALKPRERGKTFCGAPNYSRF